MRTRGWKTVVVVLVVVVAALWWMARRGRPEDRLAGRFRQICEIAGDNVKTPSRGVDRMSALLGAHGADMLRDFAELVTDVERISDDARHDDRAREAGRQMRAPLHECADTLEHFAEAVDRDEEAHAKVSRGFDRLARTLQLLVDGSASEAAPRDLRELVYRLRLSTM